MLASVFIDHNQASDTAQLTSTLNALSNTLVTLTSIIAIMQQDISELKQSQQSIQKQLPSKKKFSYWSTKMFPKYQLLMEYFGISKNGQLYSQLYTEFHNMYPGINLNQVSDDYCYENKLESCFTLDAVEHDKTIRPLFEEMVDSLLIKYKMINTYIKAGILYLSFLILKSLF